MIKSFSIIVNFLKKCILHNKVILLMNTLMCIIEKQFQKEVSYIG